MSRSADNLWERGWFQGALLNAELPLDYATIGGVRIQSTNSLWILASQDCDLEGTDTQSESLVELRPVFVEDASRYPSGVRSDVFVIDRERSFTVRARGPRLMIEARALVLLERLTPDIPESRAIHFKTWLGLRYDRPALETALIPTAELIAKAISKPKKRDLFQCVRDVMVEYTATEPAAVILYAVIHQEHIHRKTEIEAWLAEVKLRLPKELVTDVRAIGETDFSLFALENTYPAELSDLSI